MIFNVVCAVLAVALIVYTASYIHERLYESLEIMLCVDGSPVGFISDRSVIEEGADMLTAEVYRLTGEVYRYRGRLSYRFVKVAHGVSYLTAEKFRDIMLGYTDFKVTEAYALYIGGDFFCYAEAQSAIDAAVDKIEREERELLKAYGAEYLGLSVKIESCEAYVTGKEILDSRSLYTALSSALSAYSLQKPANDDSDYSPPSIFLEAADGEAQLDAIAAGLDYTDDARENASASTYIALPEYSPSLTEEDIPRLSNGEKSSGIIGFTRLCDPALDYGIPATEVAEKAAAPTESPAVSFRYSCYETVILPVQYETKYEYTSNRLTDYRKVKTEGTDGEDSVTYLSVYDGESLVSRTIASRSTLIKPTDELVELGTAEITDIGVSTGSFLWPVYYDTEPTITSYYGVRRPEFDGGGYHLGIDIYEPEGTEVYACDGGTVSYVDRTNSYGIMVIIDHDGGLQSCYAHLSEAQVVVGELVRRGQLIALSGNTGATTASHLHFEVRLDLHTIDPFKYLPDF